MIIITLKTGQGLGNQLWNIVSAYGIATKLGHQFYIENYDLFKAKDFLDFSMYSIDSHCLSAESLQFTHIHEETFFDARRNMLISGFDHSLFTRIALQANPIYLHGLLQSEDYYIDTVDLNKFFSYSKKFLSAPLPQIKFATTCILNIRGGEYKKYSDFILPKSYWTNSMQHMQNKFNLHDFLIVTDDRHYANSLFPNIPIISASIFDCYLALYRAQYVISSNSTFSYYPIATSFPHKKYIIGPKYWSQFNANDGVWLSPCNIYRGWNWMNPSGLIESYEDCLPQAKSTLDLYQNTYNIRIDDYKKLHKSKIFISSFIPGPLKKLVISLFRPIFPRYL